MKVYIDNGTPFLNDYHFKSLCLLYFPWEKFPEDDSSDTSVYFALSRESNSGLYASARIESPYGNAFAEAREGDIIFTIPTPDEELSAALTGKAFLKAGSEIFGFLPPWGYLTGLRPVKRARFYLERGYREEKVRRLFTNDYNVSAEKAELSLRTAEKEISMLSGLSRFGGRECGVYVSVPFCPTRCDYCSFVSYSNGKLFKLIPDYLERLCADIRRTGALIKNKGFVPVALYIGGGTPSFLTSEQLSGLLRCINESIPCGEVTEFSFEGGRPDTLTAEKLALIRSYGVDRISVNPQSTCQRVLDLIGRKHTVEEFYEAAERAAKTGFSTINSDLIAGLPGDTFEDFSRSLEDVVSYGFDNVTVHTLSVKNASELKNEDGIFDPVGTLARECVSYAGRRLGELGYGPYYLYRQKRTVGNGENTGFSTEGHESIYNVMMMEESSTVFACGAGAITKLVTPDGERIERIAFPKYPFEYLEKPESIGEERIEAFF